MRCIDRSTLPDTAQDREGAPSMQAAPELPSTEEEGRVRWIDRPEQTQALVRCPHIGVATDDYGIYLCANCVK